MVIMLDSYADSQREKLARTLTAGLFRAVCPAPQRLADYAAGFLHTFDALNVRAHIAECPHCAVELRGLRIALIDLRADTD